MAKKTNKLFGVKIDWQESYTSLVLGAIIVIILGLLVANFFSKRNQQIGSGEQTSQSPEQVVTASGGQHKTVAGDSLSKLAEKYYGSQELWPVLAQANNITNPDLIWTDMSLKVPSKADAESIKSQMTQTSYQVQDGDTLFIIAQKMYGDGSKWTLLDRANNVSRLPNGNPLIFAGSTLAVPR